MGVTVPAQPLIYHITHVDNLSSIVGDGRLFADSAITARGGPATNAGMSKIKARRLQLPVTCHPGDCVGDYVPFYFCPRSVMLYVLHRRNHPELHYRGGQEPLVHLVANLHAVVTWAEHNRARWAFSLANAGAHYTEFRHSIAALSEIDWAAVEARDFRSSAVRESKQAEFLVHGSLPWDLITRIGVATPAILAQARAVIHKAAHQPHVALQRGWYY